MIGFGHFPELAIVLIVALIILGPKRLPAVGSGLGKSLRELRKATSGVQDVAHRARSEVRDIARETMEPLRDLARETMEPLPSPQKQVAPGPAAHHAPSGKDVAAPAPGAHEAFGPVATRRDEPRTERE